MENTSEMYGFVERARECYQLLQDELSKEIFEARLTIDYNPSAANVARLVGLSEQQKWVDALDKELPVIIRAISPPHTHHSKNWFSMERM